MNRRQLSLGFIAAALGSSSLWKAQAIGKVPQRSDEYLLWSLLIANVHRSAGEGFLILEETVAPDAPPTLAFDPPDAMNQASRVAPSTTRSSYQTRVPPGSRTAFNQAVEHAKQDRSGEFKIERQLILLKPYRLLSPDQAHAYFNMAPSAVPVGWKPNPELVMKYKGWNELVLVSKPYFSRAHDLAIVWAKFGPSCSLQGWFFFRQMPNGWAPEHWQSKQPVTCDGKFLD